MPFQESNQIKIIIVISKGIVQVSSHIEPAKVEEELEDEEDRRHIATDLLPPIVEPLPPHKVDGKVEINCQVHNLKSTNIVEVWIVS